MHDINFSRRCRFSLVADSFKGARERATERKPHTKFRDIVKRISRNRGQVMAIIIPAGINTVAITQDERDFFVELGGRIAALRKYNHLTQVQLAETLGVAQPTFNAHELGQRCVPVSALSLLAKALGVGLEELLGETSAASKKRGPAPKLAQHMEKISQLPRTQQQFVMRMLDTAVRRQLIQLIDAFIERGQLKRKAMGAKA